jgi:hypothetical protein
VQWAIDTHQLEPGPLLAARHHLRRHWADELRLAESSRAGAHPPRQRAFVAVGLDTQRLDGPSGSERSDEPALEPSLWDDTVGDEARLPPYVRITDASGQDFDTGGGGTSGEHADVTFDAPKGLRPGRRHQFRLEVPIDTAGGGMQGRSQRPGRSSSISRSRCYLPPPSKWIKRPKPRGPRSSAWWTSSRWEAFRERLKARRGCGAGSKQHRWQSRSHRRSVSCSRLGASLGWLGCWRSRPRGTRAEQGGVRSALRVRAVAPNVVRRHHPYSPKCVEGLFSEVRMQKRVWVVPKRPSRTPLPARPTGRRRYILCRRIKIRDAA